MAKTDARRIGYLGIANAVNTSVFIAQVFALMALFDRALNGAGSPPTEMGALWLVVFFLPLIAQYALTKMRRRGKLKDVVAQEWILACMVMLALFGALWLGGEVAVVSLVIFIILLVVGGVWRVVCDFLMK